MNVQATNLPAVEGLTPLVLWYTLIGLVGIGAIIVLFDKVAKVFRDHKERKQNKESERDGTIQGQLDRLSDTITKYIQESDARVDRDNRRLNALEKQADDTNRGIKALARASLAHLQHDITGNHVDRLKDAEAMITDYLTER